MPKNPRSPLPIRVKPDRPVKLSKVDPASTEGLNKADALKTLETDAARIAAAQTLMYAEDRKALLVVLQGMDTSGKDGTIRSVFAAVNPVGLEVSSFARPSEEELDHDFLWRIHKKFPRYGNIGVFNRSHYEDVLVVRVRKLAPESIWKARFDQINAFEQLASDMGYRVMKFFLHISREEQKIRLQERLSDDRKHYKFRPGDLEDRALWDEYMSAYEDVLQRCSTKTAPWHIVPADRKWYRNALIAGAVADELESMKVKRPKAIYDPSDFPIPD